MRHVRLSLLSLLVGSALAGTALADVAAAVPCVDASSPEMKGDAYIGTREGSWAGSLDVKPGERRTLQIYVRQGPATHSPDACVEWSLEAGAAATLEAKTRTLTVDKAAPSGGAIRVRAQIKGARGPLTAELRVFEPRANPLVGVWHEVAPVSCAAPKGCVAAAEPISELEVTADGSFSVTWHPFETYRDYWGTWQADNKAGTFRFVIKDGNFKPADFRGEGRFSIDRTGNLKLDGVWLGAPGETRPGKPSCAYVFGKR